MSATTTSAGRQDAKERVCGTGTISRPRFSPGLLLLDDDLTAGVEYTRQLSRLLFRHLFGCGVVCGLKVTARHERNGDCLHVDVDAGLALDCEGDPVHVPHPQRLTVRRECGEPLPRELWVLLRRTQQDCVPRSLACPPEDGGGDSVATRLRDGYEIALLKDRPQESCGCPESAEPVGGDDTASPRLGEEAPTVGGAGVEEHVAPADSAPGPKPMAEADREACYRGHVKGVCAGCCAHRGWLVLAKVFFHTDDKLYVRHGVRRFVRPALLADPLFADVPPP